MKFRVVNSLAFPFALAAVVNGCGSANEGDATCAGSSCAGTSPATDSESALRPSERNRAMRVLTYNAALAPQFEALSAERAPLVVNALAQQAQDLDLMCVQEFWRGEDFAALSAAAKPALPYAYRQEPRPGSGTCSLEELGTLGACLQTNCPNLSGGELVGCSSQACPAEVASLHGGCVGCILNHLDGFEACAGDATGPQDPAIFAGAFDTGLLSRHPILQKDSREFDSYMVRVSALHALVAVPGEQPVHAFCTHLGSALGIVPYAGKFGSWEGEHLQQVHELLQYIEDVTPRGAPVVLLGDFNTGPAVGHNVPVWGEHYQLLRAAGFADPYASEANPLCTECSDNTFRAGDTEEDLVDHILLRGFWGARTATTRELTAKAAIPTSQGTISFNLSDHYALRTTVSLRRF